MSEQNFRLKNGCVVLVAGYTNERKTTVVKELINAAGFQNKLAFDDNREYYSADKPTDWAVFYDWEMFKKAMTAKDETTGEYLGATQCAVVFDEASKYLSAQKDEDFAKLYTACEHKFIAMFIMCTSIADFPNSLIGNAHYAMIFRTNDTADTLSESKRKKLFIPILPLKKAPGKPVFINMRQLIGAEQAK